MGEGVFEGVPRSGDDGSREDASSDLLENRIEVSNAVFADLEDGAWVLKPGDRELIDELSARWGKGFARYPDPITDGNIFHFDGDRIRVQAVEVLGRNRDIEEFLSPDAVGQPEMLVTEVVESAEHHFPDWKYIGNAPLKSSSAPDNTNAGHVLFARPSFSALIESGKIDRVPGVSSESEPGEPARDVLSVGNIKVSCEPLLIYSPKLSSIGDVYERVQQPTAAVIIRALKTEHANDTFNPDNPQQVMPDMDDGDTKENMVKIMRQLDKLGYKTVLIDDEHEYDVSGEDELVFPASLGVNKAGDSVPDDPRAKWGNTKASVADIIATLEEPPQA